MNGYNGFNYLFSLVKKNERDIIQFNENLKTSIIYSNADKTWLEIIITDGGNPQIKTIILQKRVRVTEE